MSRGQNVGAHRAIQSPAGLAGFPRGKSATQGNLREAAALGEVRHG